MNQNHDDADNRFCFGQGTIVIRAGQELPPPRKNLFGPDEAAAPPPPAQANSTAEPANPIAAAVQAVLDRYKAE